MNSSRVAARPAVVTVRDVAEASGIAPSAVRFYERFHVISAQRSAGNQRRFAADAVCRLKVAKLAQRLGLSVRDIARSFEALPAEPQPADWTRVAEQLLAEARQRLDELQRVIDAMGDAAELCAVQEALSTPAPPARQGRAPRP